MMNQNPKIQTAFRLLHFVVTKIDMKVLDDFHDKIQDEKEELKLSVSTCLGFSNENKKLFTIEYEIDLESTESKIKLQLTSTAFFESQDDINEDVKKSSLLSVNAPAIGFPFVRSFINTLTTNAGLQSLILPTFNFLNREQD